MSALEIPDIGHIFAVGRSYDPEFATYRTLIMHRTQNSGWTILDNPNPDAYSNALSGVALIPYDDASYDLWAVGTRGDSRTAQSRLLWSG